MIQKMLVYGRSFQQMVFTVAGSLTLSVAVTGSSVFAGPPSFSLSFAVKQGDDFSPHGIVSNINDVYINDNGDWIVDASLTGGTATGALIKDGQIWLAVGDVLPPGHTVSALTNLLKHLNSNGDVAFRPSFSGTPNSGVFLNTTPLVLNGQISTAPEFSPGTPYIGFFRGRVTDDGRVLAIVSVDDPNIPSSVDRALVWLRLDGKGNLEENVMFKESDPAPSAGAGVVFSDFATGADNFAMTGNGDVMFLGSLDGATTATNTGLYINNLLMVRRGDPSPVAGTEFNFTTSGRGDLNSKLEFVLVSPITVAATGTNNILVKGGPSSLGNNLLQRQGDPAPGLAETVTSFGTGAQPQLNEAGDVVWYAQLSGDASQNQSLFRNDQLLMRKGVTQIDGQTITTVLGTTATSNGIGSTVVASKNGRYIITRSVLDAGPRAAVIIEFEQTSTPCPADIQPPGGDGEVNANDLLAVINNWGPCPSKGPCPGNVTPDGIVNANDLLAVINSWGPCPK